jgi:hypothetical protein
VRSDGLLVLGSLSNNSSINVELVVPPFVANGAMGFPKAVDWVLDLRDRKRVVVLGLSWGISSSFWEELG